VPIPTSSCRFPNEHHSLCDCHFTVLGFTAANGQLILCATILACKVLKVEYIMGVNHFAEVVDANLMDKICDGEDKCWFPYGPNCYVRGTKVPCFVGHSENGSIMSKLLAAMLQHMDVCCIFNSTDGVLPFLLHDGHGSRFELPFLEYINNPMHMWKMCIGVPYGTSIWQVGDSAEQMGASRWQWFEPN